MLKSAIKNAEISEKHVLGDDSVYKILRKELKQRQESIVEYEKGGRDDLATKEKTEINLIQNYLPKELPEEQVKSLVDEAITTLDATQIKDMGKVIAFVMQKANGQIDGAKVSQIVKEKLSK
jgi:uncharacterized protein